MRGLKLHPPLQQFVPSDRVAYPLYEVFAEARLPVVFHTGHSGIGSGMRGGGGVRLKYGNPMPIDDVAVDFPDLPIVMAHPSFPWQDEAISVCLHKPQVRIDLSGWSPKYFSPVLVQYANTLLREKVLFGSDYPLITPDRWLADFAAIGIRDEVRPLILKHNAARLLGLVERAARGRSALRRQEDVAMPAAFVPTRSEASCGPGAASRRARPSRGTRRGSSASRTSTCCACSAGSRSWASRCSPTASCGGATS